LNVIVNCSDQLQLTSPVDWRGGAAHPRLISQRDIRAVPGQIYHCSACCELHAEDEHSSARAADHLQYVPAQPEFSLLAVLTCMLLQHIHVQTGWLQASLLNCSADACYEQ
jgi:hypothetical protein